MTRLVTERASQAAVTQRAGRAARQRPGVAYRLWEAAATAGLPRFDPPEILEADLSALVLDCARTASTTGAWARCWRWPTTRTPDFYTAGMSQDIAHLRKSYERAELSEDASRAGPKQSVTPIFRCRWSSPPTPVSAAACRSGKPTVPR